MNGLGRGLAHLPAESEDEPAAMHAEGNCRCMACLWSMSYYYPTAGSTMDKPGMYPGSLQGTAPVPGTLGYQQQSSIQPAAPTRMPAGYTGSTLPGAQAFQSMGPTGYPGTAGSPYATLSASPFGAPAGLYQHSGLGYATAHTLASPTLASPQSMYASARVPATSTPTQVFPGTAAAHYAGGGMYGYSMPMTATPNPYSPSMAAYPAGAMPGAALSSYASVPGAAPLGPGATYPGSSPYSRQMP